jgi:tetratricopeptide (TPR) repeat protein
MDYPRLPRIYFLFLLLLCLFNNLSALDFNNSTGLEDSSIQVLRKLPPAALADTLNILFKEICSNDPEKGLAFTELALAEAEEAGYKLGQARALSNSGYAYLFLGKHDNALKVYLLSQAIYQEIDDQDGKANITYSIGQTYYFMSDYHQALQYYTRALELYNSINDIDGTGKTYYDIGYIYYDQGKYSMAFEKFQAGLKVTNEEEVYDHINNSLYNGVGHVLIELKDYEESIKYYQRSLEINRKLDDRPGIAHSINNIGNVYYYWGKYEEAFGYYEQALAKFNETGYKMGAAIAVISVWGCRLPTLSLESLRQLWSLLSGTESLGGRRYGRRPGVGREH